MMHVALVVVFAICLATVRAAIPEASNQEEINMEAFAVFNDLSKEAAMNKAREMAQNDFAKNVYRILVVGKRPPQSAYDNYLKQRYGVLVTPIAGCLVSDGILGAEEGYNQTMKPLLNRKFGHDIFKEAEEAGRK